MMLRLLSIILALVLAYIAVPLIAPYLPTIHLKTEIPAPQTLDEAVSLYLARESGESVSFVTSPYTADWDSDSKHKYYIYELSNNIPTSSKEYSGTGNQLESTYESFLLSVRPGEDPTYDKLRAAYLFAKPLAVSNHSAKRGYPKQTRDPKRDALNAMVTYLQRRTSGPTEARMGRALAAYYGDYQPQIEYPGGHLDNARSVSTSPDLSNIHAVTTTTSAVEFIVPSVGTSSNGQQVAQAQKLTLVSLTINRPWLDLDLLESSTRGPWYGSTPNFFGPTGTLGRVPIRIVLLQRPQIQVASVKVDDSNPNKVAIGPFSYSKDEIKNKRLNAGANAFKTRLDCLCSCE